MYTRDWYTHIYRIPLVTVIVTNNIFKSYKRKMVTKNIGINIIVTYDLTIIYFFSYQGYISYSMWLIYLLLPYTGNLTYQVIY